MQDRGNSSGRKLSGRPNQGKTETIRQRKVDVYLPTTELLQQWKEAADSSGMPLSKYVLEVVEQHRQGVQKLSMSPFMLEEKANRLEKEVTDLRLRLETLQSAFRNQEVELTHLSGDFMKSKEGCVDIPMVRRMVQALRSAPKEGLHYEDMWKVMKVNHNDADQMEKWSRAINFLLDVGLAAKSDDGMFWWVNGR
ncbi:MAG: hypothetical protein A4E32_00481 [Methanomassiliicoccales archaeon PtaU1.Bin124]|nr:MAG: hypothetical protein A4E32_00481 [Methanomassiliicoccales archaeon PtaU1.Bin124]